MKKFTKKESLIMDKLWESEKPMTARDIADEIMGMSIYSVQQVLSRLLEDEVIIVTGITHNKNAIARQYEPRYKEAEYLASIMNNKKTGLQFTENFVGGNSNLDELAALQRMIESRIKDLK